jgi:RNA polymerase sigma-70 factor (ECF subfamily)
VIDALRRIEDTESIPEYHDEVDEDRSMIQALHEMISQLEEPDRSIVRMQLEGYSYEEIGARLGMTEKNVSVRLVRTKEKLKKMMGVAE